MKIMAKLMQDSPVFGYSTARWISYIPVVVESDHPEYTPGSRFDYGFLQVALSEGYEVVLLPADLNKSNCRHERGFDLGIVVSSYKGKESNVYSCPICHLDKFVPRTKKPKPHIPAGEPPRKG